MSGLTASDAPLFWRAEDLPAWRRWQRAQWPAARRAVDTARGLARGAARAARGTTGGEESGLRLLLPGAGPVHTLIALESFGPTQLAALAAPAEALGPDAAAGIGWVLPAGDPSGADVPPLPGAGAHALQAPDEALRGGRLEGLERVLVAGEYLPSGRAAVRWARERGAAVAVVQHGLLAASTPPVPRDSTLYAFTPQDGAWWTQGRGDVTVVPTGSALLQAARRTAGETASTPEADPGEVGLFLGQLHGAELPRADFARAAEEYLRATGAAYRPHPAERDRLSRRQHAAWRVAGLRLDDSGLPLARTRGPVASVFSTGVLEAAQAGRPAWVTHPDPPAWLEGFWERYGMVRWRPGTDPRAGGTPPLASPSPDPAAAIAAHFWPDLPADALRKDPA